MEIVIHCGGIPFNGETVNERSLGGSESAAYYVAKELARRGHRVVLFTEHEEGGVFDGVEYVPMGPRDQQSPLGKNWHWYCTNTPHDVNIVQRFPGSFMFPIRSKINLWWAHDIALKRSGQQFTAGLWQTNAILPVSHWFKKQIEDVWGCNPDIVEPITNGVDYTIFDQYVLKDNSKKQDKITLLYSSRPERGLENLVGVDGIMERLMRKGIDNVELLVCGYEHPAPHLSGMYQHLHERCEQLPNVTHLGQLPKAELNRIQCEVADIWCYPTQFEEVSCITAMEAMAAGMKIMFTDVAALKETIGPYKNKWMVRYETDEQVIKDFTTVIASWAKKGLKFHRESSRPYSWERTVDTLEDIIRHEFKKQFDLEATARHFMRHNDVVALTHIPLTKVSPEIWEEYDKFYPQWATDPVEYAKHYEQGTERCYEADDFQYETEDFIYHSRFAEIARDIAENAKPGDVILDYGCAHGHFTNYLAKMFDQLNFVGVDISPEALRRAKEKQEELGLPNVVYMSVDEWQSYEAKVDVIILGEILEHVHSPQEFMQQFESKYGAVRYIITTPFGPWEAQSDITEMRFHLHHFERMDLEDMFSQHENLQINCVPAGVADREELLGWYVTKFNAQNPEVCRPIDYDRKIAMCAPKQTVSFCIIVKDGEDSLGKCLKSVAPYVDEFVIGIDENTTDTTQKIVDDFEERVGNMSAIPKFKFIDIKSPLETGFDEARNTVIEKATMQWIMWADADEELVQGHKIVKYLRQNGFNGYGTPQHHFSVEPLGVLTTDYPVRLFRRSDDIRFRGVVHEHPENIHKDNDGVGYAYILHEVHFAHHGYTTEEIRRKRFQRNIDLMVRDREKYPDRILGKFLWIRDLALMCRFELEQTGQVSEAMFTRAMSGIKLWEETVTELNDHPQVKRMIKDHIDFYDTLVRVSGRGFFFSICLNSSAESEVQLDPSRLIKSKFFSKKHLDLFLSTIIEEEVQDYEDKYL